jgi:hypothetical protein
MSTHESTNPDLRHTIDCLRPPLYADQRTRTLLWDRVWLTTPAQIFFPDTRTSRYAFMGFSYRSSSSLLLDGLERASTTVLTSLLHKTAVMSVSASRFRSHAQDSLVLARTPAIQDFCLSSRTVAVAKALSSSKCLLNKLRKCLTKKARHRGSQGCQEAD